ncbi:hypothetical protein GCM10009676_46340 [Prauserella halophila]|uniref:Sulfatase-modifying factor enzyme 1 n=1 Tax=Prauserella halophila TaxID=185641 RepID=A0ABN1WLK0_9PSEU
MWVPAYDIDVYPVTNAQYARFLDDRKSVRLIRIVATVGPFVAFLIGLTALVPGFQLASLLWDPTSGAEILSGSPGGEIY